MVVKIFRGRGLDECERPFCLDEMLFGPGDYYTTNEETAWKYACKVAQKWGVRTAVFELDAPEKGTLTTGSLVGGEYSKECSLTEI